MKHFSFKNILAITLFSGSLGFAEEAWVKNNLNDLTMRLNYADVNLDLDPADSDLSKARQLLAPNTLNEFEADHERALELTEFLKKNLAEISQASQGKAGDDSVPSLVSLTQKANIELMSLRKKWTRSLESDVREAPLDPVSISREYPTFKMKAGTTVIKHLNFKFIPRQITRITYAPEMGLSAFISFQIESGMGEVETVREYIFKINCAESLVYDTIANAKVPFMSPLHILKCDSTNGRGRLIFTLSQ